MSRMQNTEQKYIYMDSAATSLWHPNGVEEAMIHALKEAGNPSRGAYEPSLLAGRVLLSARKKITKMIGAESDTRIIFTSGATQSLNTAIFGLIGQGDHVITSAAEHNAVLRPLHLLEREEGVSVSYLPVDKTGEILTHQLPELLRPNTKAVVISHASNVTGLVTDLPKIAEFTREHGLCLIVDAAQTFGLIPIDVVKTGIDVLCFTGHKALGGPTGTGGIYLREGLNMKPLLYGGTGIYSFLEDMPDQMPTHLEAGTQNVVGIAGLNAALDYNMREHDLKRMMTLKNKMRTLIRDIPGIHLYGDSINSTAVPILSLNLEGISSAELSDLLWEEGRICVRAGAHCAPLIHKAFGTERQGIVRFSFSPDNTEEEMEFAVNLLRDIAADCR